MAFCKYVLHERLRRYYTPGKAKHVRSGEPLVEEPSLSSHLDRAARTELGLSHWRRYETRHGHSDLSAAVEILTPLLLADPAADLPAGVLPYVADAAADRLASAPADGAARLWQRITAATPPGHPARAARLARLCVALRTRRPADDDDVDHAVRAGQEAVACCTVDDRDGGVYPAALMALAAALWERHLRTGSSADLDASIAVHGHAARLSDDPMALTSLAGGLLRRHESTGSERDLDAAVEAGLLAANGPEQAADDRVDVLAMLASAVDRRFEERGDPEDLDTMLEIARESAGLAVTPGEWARHVALTSRCLRLRFDLATPAGDPADLDDAIATQRSAIAQISSDDPDYAPWLLDLAECLRARYEITNDQGDLDDAVAATREAVRRAPPGSLERLLRLSSLGSLLIAGDAQ